MVTVQELVKGVNIALGTQPLADCPAVDANGDDHVTVNELLQAVRAALDGCVPATATATSTSAATPSSTASTTPTATRTPEARPNVLLINLDDSRADGIDRMPTVLARLAAQGVSFRNSFVVDSLCAPSRASLFTGLYARHHGTKTLGGVIGGAQLFRESGADRQTIAVWLQAAGYQTGLFGKYINGYAQGPTEQEPDGTFYVPPGWTRWRGMQSPEHYGGISGRTYTLVDEHGFATAYDDHTTDVQYSTDVLAAELRAFVADAVGQNRPFFAIWTPFASHADTPSLLPLPAARDASLFLDLPPWRPASWDEADVTDKPRWVQRLPAAGPSDPVVSFTDTVRLDAYRTLAAVDEDLGAVLDQLADLGIDDRTVVIFTSDNGVAWGEHRLWGQIKEAPYEECLRVPLIVRDPRGGGTGIVRDAAVLNIDIAPTVAALAGVVPPVPTDGLDFAPWVRGAPPAQWRSDFLLEHWRGDRNDQLSYSGQVTDGDQVRLFYGDSRAHPARASVLFEFDSGDGVASGAAPVAIGATADASFAALGNAIALTVPFTAAEPDPAHGRLIVVDNSPGHDGVYLWIERDQGAVIQPAYPLPDFFGVRDVSNGVTYVEHETGEVELYDLAADPAELENKAGDPGHAAARQQLAQRLEELLQ